MEEKRELRARLRREREERFTPHSWEQLASAPEISSALTIASYISYGFEPSTQELNRALLVAGKRILLPRVKDDNDLEWVYWDGSETTLKQVKKFQEPVGDAIADESLIDLVIVPALAVDSSGVRMGQGGGSYDRALPRLKSWKVALVNDEEIVDSPLPSEAHDVKMDAAATPASIKRFN